VGFEFIIFPAAGLVTLLVLLGFAWFARAQRDHDAEIQGAWRSYAKRHGAVVQGRSVESRGGEGWGIHAIWTNGKRSTRMTIRRQIPRVGELRVAPKPAVPTHTPTGDPAFDAYFTVVVATPHADHWLLSTSTRRALAQFNMGQFIEYAYKKGVLSLTWEGWETNTARLDEARRLLESADTPVP
jgi:hypothetical protein